MSGSRPFQRRRWLFRELFEALTLGFGQEEDCDDQSQDADDGGRALCGRQAVPVHKEREGEDAEEATDLAHGSSGTMTSSSNLYWKDLRRVDEGGGIRAELGKEITEAVDDQEWVHQLLDIGNEGEQAKAQRHHSETGALYGLVAKLFYGQRRDRITGAR